MNGPADDPRATRQRRLSAFLRAATVAAFVVALAGLLLPGHAATIAGVAMVGLLVAVPLLRLGWLATRWLRKGDRRFAVVALTLAVIVVTGAALGR